MRRRLLIIAAFLLAGAVVNVAVAWGCAQGIFRAKPSAAQLKTQDAESAWRQYAPIGWQAPPFYLRGWRQRDAQRTVVQLGRDHASPHLLYNGRHRYRDLRVIELGLPARCIVQTQFRLSWGSFRPRPPPVVSHRPIWGGLIVNAVVYAAILWLLIPGTFTLRRLRRIKNGLCPKCAYPVGESSVCTECGKELAT